MSHENEEKEQHGTYGMIGFHRASWGGGGGSLFGSSIRHGNVIRLEVKTASRRRSLHRDLIRGETSICEVYLSQNQFAELLTTMNVGDGVPCTIRSIGGRGMGVCPSVEKRQEFENEFKADVAKAMKDANAIAGEAMAALGKKGNITQAERTDILGKLKMLVQHINSNMPFVQTSFNEAMDKTVAEAKAEVEAFVGNKIHSLGIDALSKEVAKAIASTTESPALQLDQ